MKALKLLCLIIVLSALAACGLDNTMYNARNYFKSAQAKPLNTNGRPNAQAIDEYTKCIQKCGIIISSGKKGARLDDAVFLMAKALYYKGNSAFQAKDQFENLIKGFPDSPFVPEAHIYIARILREINQPEDAEKRLDEFIRDPQFTDHHPQALLVLADFAIKDKDYSQAQFWLDKIIREHPKTKEFKEAYFLFGKNYYEQQDYESSREAFVKMRHARRIDKAMKLDADYYIALNDLYLNENERALSEARKLVKMESRPEKLSSVRLLLGRILMATGEHGKALAEMEAVTKNYPRTEAAAGAFYFLGEYHYYLKSDITNAITNYNRVRTEFSASEFATVGQNKATALNNVKPNATLSSETALTQFLDYHYLAAESFVGTLALPDSAVASYRRVISERDTLVALQDSLRQEMALQQVSLDSLALIVEDTLAVAMDTLQVTEKVIADTLLAEQAETADSLLASGIVAVDTLAAMQDSTAADPGKDAEPEARPNISQQKQELQTRITALEARIAKIDESLLRFDNEIIPFCLFALGSMRHSSDPEHPESQAVMDTLQDEYPANKYTKAFKALLAGQPIRLIDPLVEEQEAILDSLLGMVSTSPDSAIAGLERLRESPVPEVQLAANYRLGWYYSFEVADTIAAKPYLQEVLDNTASGEYGTTVRKFYDGNKYLLWGAEVFKDSLVAVPDSVISQITITEPDSLADTLQVVVPETETLPAPEEPELIPEEKAPEAIPDAKKEEEQQLE